MVSGGDRLSVFIADQRETVDRRKNSCNAYEAHCKINFGYWVLLWVSINTHHKILNDVFIVFNIASSHLAKCPYALFEHNGSVKDFFALFRYVFNLFFYLFA